MCRPTPPPYSLHAPMKGLFFFVKGGFWKKEDFGRKKKKYSSNKLHYFLLILTVALVDHHLGLGSMRAAPQLPTKQEIALATLAHVPLVSLWLVGSTWSLFYPHEVCHSCTWPSSHHSTCIPRTMVLAHSWCLVPQTDAQGLKKKQCSLWDLSGVWKNCISLAHPSVCVFSPQLMVTYV